MPTVEVLTLAQACALLDTGGSLDNDNYIDAAAFSGAGSRNQDLADLLWHACRKVYQDAKFRFFDVTITPTSGDQRLNLGDGTIFTARLTDTRDFGVNLFDVLKVRVNRTWLLDGAGNIGMWSMDHFQRWWYDWQNATSGKPQAATVDYGGNCLLFNRPFSAGVVSSGNISCIAHGYPAQFDYAADSAKVWVVHPHLQMAVVKRAIVDSKIYYATEFDELGLMDRLSDESKADVRAFRDKMTDQASALQDSWPGARDTDAMRL